ncbi:hypothetical protein KP509_07G075700 [Ceratopteris richardii]|uniref:Uncharacterized protein n=1 Tax=Ceratopteris richardii TaxID=49495 RepID=A0A8T2UGE2_CERRI|nr:hypothetical protein KP509_07G075700 [Ceratopteris richardii]
MRFPNIMLVFIFLCSNQSCTYC